MQLRSKLFYLYACMVVAYAATFLFPRPISTYQTYNLTLLEYRLLSLTVFIPLVLIWYAAFYGYAKLRAYSRKIANTLEGPHINRLAIGIMILAVGLPVTSVFSAIMGLLAQHQPSWTGCTVIAKNYINVCIPLAGFIFLSWGARGLAALSSRRTRYRNFALLLLLFAAIGATYCYTTLSAPNLASIYHLPGWIVTLTITLPSLFSWYLGIMAAFEIRQYNQSLPGLLYRGAWNMLANGLSIVLLVRIAIQYISVATAQIGNSLVRLLLIVYVLEVLLAAGYITVAVGAKRLLKIEEV